MTIVQQPIETLRPWSPEWYAVQAGALGESACRALGFYVIPPEMRLSVVIPVYNEEKPLRVLVDRVREVPIRKELILIDDCSKDRTRDVLKALEEEGRNDDFNRVRIFFHDVNQGKGAALRTGFSKVEGDIVIIQDADLEYDPNDYIKLLKPIQRGLADVVYGSRFRGGEPHRVIYYKNQIGNKFLTMFSNIFTGLNLTDMETCYKMFDGDLIRQIARNLQSQRFGFEPEVTARIAKSKARIYEVGISYYGRSYAEGKKITWKDGVKAVGTIIKYRFVK